MNEISLQGILSTTGTTLFVVPRNNIYKVVSMRFNNPAAYNLTLTKYSAKTSSSITVYSLALSAGDTVTDNFVYFLEEGEYLTVTSSVPGTSYIVSGIFYPIA